MHPFEPLNLLRASGSQDTAVNSTGGWTTLDAVDEVDARNKEMVGCTVICGVVCRSSEGEGSPTLQVPSAWPSLRAWKPGNVKLDVVDSEFRASGLSRLSDQSAEVPSRRTRQVVDIYGLFVPASWVRGLSLQVWSGSCVLGCRCLVQIHTLRFTFRFGPKRARATLTRGYDEEVLGAFN